jgi:hypothetical protein
MPFVTDEIEIRNLVNTFRQSIISGLETRLYGIDIGQRQDGQEETWWSDRIKLWINYNFAGDQVVPGTERYWTAFGVEKPFSGCPITVEINFPVSGIDWHIAGGFFEVTPRKFLVVHTGKINGIPMKYFFQNYRGETTTLWTKGVYKRFAVVGHMDHPDFLQKVKKFVSEVDRIRNI